MAHQRRPHLNAGADALAAAVLGDDSAITALTRIDPAVVCGAAEHHGVLPLLAERLAGRADLPEPWLGPLAARASRHLAEDLEREAELRHSLAALDRAGLPALVIKGADLAYRYYARPDLRPRIDTDLLVPHASVAGVADALVREGYVRRAREMTGDLVTSQAMYVKRRDGAVAHAIDVHWRMANPQIFAGVLAYDELAQRAVPIPALGRSARGLSPVHALLLACVHRVAHHYDAECLIWLYDIHLIAGDLGPSDWEAFGSLAQRRGVAAVCRQGLRLAQQRFRTAWPSGDAVWSSVGESEATAAYLTQDRTRAAHVWTDLRALPAWNDRWRLMREHVFPPARYMRDVYAPASAAPLPVLYLRRVLGGARKWLVRF